MARTGRLEELTARQAASRLGVKVETVYAYVSRGILERRSGEDGRSSRFDARAIERLARQRRGGPRTGGLSVVLGTALTLIEADRVCYRGLDLAALPEAATFEAVAEWLWLGDTPPGDRPIADVWRASPDALAAARVAADIVPHGTAVADRLRVIAAVAGNADPLRFDLAPDAVAQTGRRLIAALVDGLPLAGSPGDGPPRPASGARRQALPGAADASRSAAYEDAADTRIAARLAARLCPGPIDRERVDCLDTVLCLIADHGLAASTLAARVAASTRADPYSVVGAGLAALSGPLHGAASAPVHRLFRDVGDPARAVAVVGDALRHEARIPGFGHVIYKDWDPRARILHARLRDSRLPEERWAVVEAVLGLLEERAPVRPNIDFLIGAFTYCAGMDERAGEALFGVARCAGWLAHAIEEYAEPALRFRPRAHYTGVTP